MSATVTTPIKISPDEVAACRDDGDFSILDGRNEDDNEEWPLKDSYNLPIYDELLEEALSGLAAIDKPPTNEELVVVCVAGIERSLKSFARGQAVSRTCSTIPTRRS